MKPLLSDNYAILSACGHETVILPTAVLSSHTGGFGKPVVRHLSDMVEDTCRHWQENGITFDAIYVGYLGSIAAVEQVSALADNMLAPGGKLIVDPAMADHGKLYSGFDTAYAEAMQALCEKADVMIPNITEAAMMTGLPYRENYEESYIADLLKALGGRDVVLTGVSREEGKTGMAIRRDGKVSYFQHARIGKSYHGTGDMFASAFVGSLMRGKSAFDAARIAADYTLECIRCTAQIPNHWYGAAFEPVLGRLIEMLK